LKLELVDDELELVDVGVKDVGVVDVEEVVVV
jgi:hypothetical protein